MPDKKLTDSEIKKALECCDGSFDRCGECPLDNVNQDKLRCWELEKSALDLINRLQAENKRLSTLAELGNTRANDYRVMRDRALKAEAENEKLCAEIDELIIAKDLLFDEAEALIKKAKAEAYKEFAERLKKEHFLADEHDIDNLLKEMIGE